MCFVSFFFFFVKYSFPEEEWQRGFQAIPLVPNNVSVQCYSRGLYTSNSLSPSPPRPQCDYLLLRLLVFYSRSAIKNTLMAQGSDIFDQ